MTEVVSTDNHSDNSGNAPASKDTSPAEASSVTAGASASTPQSPEIARIFALYQSQKMREAVQAAQAFLRTYPQNVEALHLMGISLLALNDFRNALAALRRASELSPNNPAILNSAGAVYRRINRVEDALRCFAAAVNAGPELMLPRVNLAQMLCRQKRFVEAERVIAKAVENFPNAPPVLIILATIQTESKAFGETFINLGKALIQMTTKPEDLPEGGVQLDTELPPEEVLRRVKRLPPAADELVFLLARVYHESARTNLALDLIEAAMHISANSITLLALLGNIRSARNEVARAQAVYEQVLNRQPTAGAVHLLLADITKYAGETPHLGDMRRLAASKNLQERDRCHVSFALAKALDDVGDYAAAAKHLDTANEIKHKEYTSVTELNRGRHAHMREVFTADFLKSMRRKGCQDETPIFIVGMPRSGTTLTEQILSTSDKVTPGEEQFLMLEITRRITYLDTGSKVHFPQNVLDMSPKEIAAYGQQYVDRLRGYKGEGPRITDKMPHNHESVGFILASLPKAKIVHCYRDPRDTCLSIWKHHFEGNHPYAYNREELATSFRMYQDLMAHWRTIAGDRIIEIGYEDLVNDLEATTRRLFKYCGLKWTEKALEFHKSTRTVRTASLQQVRRPIYKSSMAAWEKYAPHEAELFAHLKNAGVRDWSEDIPRP